MANDRYAYSSERWLTGQLNWLSQAFKVVLVDTSLYAFQKAIHHTLADVPVAARVAVSGALANKSATLGTARADDITIGPVFGNVVSAFIIFHDTGVDSTSELIAYYDVANGLPYDPQGDSVKIHWDVGSNGIFTL